MWRLILLRSALLILLLTLVPGQAAWAESVTPVDEASKHEGLERVRDSLIRAFEAEDAEAAGRYIHPFVENRVTGETGREEFIAWLKAGDGRWRNMAGLLGRGGRMVAEDAFVAPWSAGLDPGETALTAAYVAGTEVRLREGPGTDAKILNALSYERVTVPEWALDYEDRPSPEGWLRIVTSEGETGYMAARFVAPLADYTLRFAEVRGVWWLKVIDTNYE